MKRTAQDVLRRAAELYGTRLGDQQELLTAAADVMIEAYASESALLRATAAGGSLHAAAASSYVADAVARVRHSAYTARCAMSDSGGDWSDLPTPAVNPVELRRGLAAAAIERRSYPF